MPVPSSTVGATTEAFVHDVDARWTMAYAAGVDDPNPRYLDTTRPDGVVAHPLFPVCPEWPVVLAARRLAGGSSLTRAEAARSVHATHDLVVHRLVTPGDQLTTTATIDAVERRRPGAFQVIRIDTVDAAGAPVATTRMGVLYVGVEVEGPDHPVEPELEPEPEPEPEPGGVAPRTGRAERPVPPTAAHTYTACARIWNPIHTDRAVALAAGLPDVILHGTATLAGAITAIVDAEAAADPTRVARLRARFAAPVLLPDHLTITWRTTARRAIAFEVHTATGSRAIRDGLVTLAP